MAGSADLGRAEQVNDGQMLSALDVAHFKSDLVTAGTTAASPRSAAAGIGQDDAGERDGVEDARLDVLRPLFR